VPRTIRKGVNIALRDFVNKEYCTVTYGYLLLWFGVPVSLVCLEAFYWSLNFLYGRRISVYQISLFNSDLISV
jgi:hypothetical protein